MCFWYSVWVILLINWHMNGEKILLYNNLVYLQCVRQDTPIIGPILGFSGVEQSKVFLNVWISKNRQHIALRNHFCEGYVSSKFLKLKNSKNTFDCSTPAYFCRQHPIFIFRQTFPIHCTVRQKGSNVVVSINVTFCCFWTFWSFKKLEGDRWGVT